MRKESNIMKKLLFSSIAAGLILAGTFEQVQADSINVNDMKLNGHSADAAIFLKDNDSATELNDLVDIKKLFSGNEFTFITKDDPLGGAPATGTLGTIEFELLASSSSTSKEWTSGTWTLSWSSASTIFPITIDLVAVLKAGNGYAAFLFDDEILSVAGTNISDPWVITFENGGKQIPDLSHFSLYGRDVTPQTPVPEPATLLLFGSGLIAFASLRRRKPYRRD